MAKFLPGQIVSTPGALKAFAKANELPSKYLALHLSGNWGDVDAHDKKVNDNAVKNGERIISSYILLTGEKIWIITEADRSVTTFLLPEEY